jgi:hypothetical protein
MSRAWLPAALVLIAGVLLPGCVPQDRVGFTADSAGRVSAENCGTWISGVTVLTGEESTWSTSAPQRSDGGYQDLAGVVEIGRAPDGWATTGTAPAPGQPLQIVVTSANNDPLKADLPALQPGGVYYDGRLRSDDFTTSCGTFYPYGSWVSGTGILLLCLGVLVGVLLLLRARRRASPRPRPAPPRT